MPVQLPPNSTGTAIRTVNGAGILSGDEREVITLTDVAGALIGPATETTLAAVLARLLATLTVSGPLTDAQLRASAVPVSGTVTTSGTVALDGTTLTALEQIEARSPLKALALDYTGRTDSQPVYLGTAAPATADAAVAWTVTRFTYESAANDARVTRSDVRSPIKWTNRADPTLDGQPAW